jgi:hypothetical protein
MTPKPLLCKVAVITEIRDFMNWVDINQGETYACVNRIDNAWEKV